MDPNDKRLDRIERVFDDGKALVSEVRQLRAGQEALLNEQRRLNRRLYDVWNRLHTVARTADPDLFEIVDSIVNELIELRATAAPPLSDLDRLGKILENVSAKLYDKQAREDIVWLSQEIARLRTIIKDVNRRLNQVVWVSPEYCENTREIVTAAVRHVKGSRTELAKTHDILAEALGYEKAPTAEEDPDCPCPGDYVTGEHTTETLAAEAAELIAELKRRNAALKVNYKETRNTVKRLLGTSTDDDH